MVTIRSIAVQGLRTGQAYELLRKSVYKATTEKCGRLIDALAGGNSCIYTAEDSNRKLGIFAVLEIGSNRYEIKALFVEREWRKEGVGRRLVNGLITDRRDPVIVAETDGDAVGFYHSLGFKIHSLGEIYPGIERFNCVYDHSEWFPYPYAEIIRMLQKADIRCWVSGGIAIDLYIGHQTREHHDVDISILRKDQMALREVLKDWEIYHTHAPGLRFWRDNTFLEKIPNVWVRRDGESPWAFEIMFQESLQDRWLYRRNTSIQKPIEEIGLVTDDGIPYLRPEIQLLFKGGGSSHGIKKNIDDLMAVLPLFA